MVVNSYTVGIVFAALSLSVLAACTSAVPAIEAEHKPSISRDSWHLVGLADDSHIPLPTLQDGRDVLGTACFTINQRLTAFDPQHPAAGPPCGVEQWADGSAQFRLYWAGQAALIEQGTVERRALVRWNALDGVLAACLGPPLNLPPAADPEGTRTTDGETWTLHFSGANRCGLGGTMRLWMRADRSNVAGVTVDGRAWAAGGAELAASRLLGP